MKRELGGGRWDRVLIKRMVELSTVDNYEEAKDEWEATGNVWWGGINRDSNSHPSWVAKHPRECLCGHKIVYHYEILNTKNGIRECVGSDHINSYLIIKAIRSETGLTDEYITDAMIEEWISVRVKGMKAEAWWAENGEGFTEMFDAIKDLDLRVNVRDTGVYYDYTYKMNRPKTQIRKKGDSRNMASIVWRWNHPDNAKAQIITRGYPNKTLLGDLYYFHRSMEEYIIQLATEDDILENRLAKLKIIQEIRANFSTDTNEQRLHKMLEYYGLSNFDEFSVGLDDWSTNFLDNMRRRLGRAGELTDGQLSKLAEILTPATEKQLKYLQSLGYEGNIQLSKRQASNTIEEMNRAA